MGVLRWYWTRAALLVVASGVGLASPVNAQGEGQAGRIRGRAVDAGTRQPLSGVAVSVLDSGLGAVTDSDGAFSIAEMRSGLHRLLAVVTGYEPVILHDVVVRTNRVTTVTIDLDIASPAVRETVDVTADYFSAPEERNVSTVSLDFEEIRRSPGSAGDVSRLLHALPSVGASTDQRNDLIVRGGSPLENLTIVDNVEVPNINHFPAQGASGGAVGILNVDLISDVSFTAGGFSAEHGDRLSSVMVVTQREGNRIEFDGEVNMSMSGGASFSRGRSAPVVVRGFCRRGGAISSSLAMPSGRAASCRGTATCRRR